MATAKKATKAPAKAKKRLLVVESLNSWVIDLRIDGREVTPTLNALCHDTINNLLTVNIRTQVKNGRSSDGIFMYNTGLLPLTTQAVANTYGKVPYPSLAKMMGNYDSFYACCDEPTLWNVREMSSTYGYSDFYGRAEIDSVIKNNGFLIDKALLEEVTELRNQFRAAGVEYCVLKNTLVRRALDDMGITGLDHTLEGPSAYAFGMTDAVAPAKIVFDFINKTKNDGRLTVKAGLMDGEVLSVEQVKALSEVPPREVLLARLVGSLQAPVAKLVYFLEALRKQQAGEE